mgnify:CR=1 FL=1
MTNVVLFEELVCENDKKIAIATLNSPKSLNALSGEMIELLYPQLLQWQQQESVVAVFIQGSGEKAFCAGGDIVHLYQSMKNNVDESNKYAPEITEYFTKEYQLDYLIHQFTKPIIVWGHGIVMGGGLGLLSGASHRIVTEKSRIAMPEISIGLFPDVGASYFLNKMPSGNGLFLALTGASINAADAKFCQLADFYLEHERKDAFQAQLTKLNWSQDTGTNHQMLNVLLSEVEQDSLITMPSSHLLEHQSFIEALMRLERVEDVFEAIVNLEIEDKWFNRAQTSLKSGSALSAHITYRQLTLGKALSLADCFRLELLLAVKSGKFGEFSEGVRALLIDKDNKPQWRFDSPANVDKTVIEWFFETQWPDEQHPLADLGK